MKEYKSGIGVVVFLSSILLFMCAPVSAQHTDNLGGNWNDPAGGKITNIIVARYARRRSEKRPAVRDGKLGPNKNEGWGRFSTTRTPHKKLAVEELIRHGGAGRSAGCGIAESDGRHTV